MPGANIQTCKRGLAMTFEVKTKIRKFTGKIGLNFISQWVANEFIHKFS